METSEAVRPAGNRSRVLFLLCILLWIMMIMEVVIMGLLFVVFLMQLLYPFSKQYDTSVINHGLIESSCVSIVRLVATYIALSMLSDLRAGRPFLEKNVQRLVFIGWGFLAFAAYKILNESVTNYHAGGIKQIFTNLLDTTADVPILISLCLFALAEVFKHGLVLRQEQDFTV